MIEVTSDSKERLLYINRLNAIRKHKKSRIIKSSKYILELDIEKQMKFESLCAPYMSAFTGFANKFARESDAIEGSDILQHALMNAYRFLDKYQEGTNFKSWVFTLIKNTSINFYRNNEQIKSKGNIRYDLAINEGEEDRKDTMSGLGIYDKLYFDVEGHNDFAEGLSDEFFDAWNRLRSDWKVILKLAYIDNLPDYEIAEVLKIPGGTVKSRLHRAIKSLKYNLRFAGVNVDMNKPRGCRSKSNKNRKLNKQIAIN